MTNVTAEGSVSDSAYIGEANAKAIALAHADLDSGSITAYKCKLDREDGRMVYEIDFRCGGFEYEYEIDAVSGAVVKQDKDMGGR
ncbi:MAG: PepSY domain-containing protein [Christensenellales bacterium]